MSAGLSVRDVTVRYGGVVANDSITLAVPPGQVTGLIGPNGAGKTTLVDAISGFAPASGDVLLDGTSVRRLRPHRRRRAGLSRTWQSGELFGNLTVRENVMVAVDPGGFGALVRDLLPRRRGDDDAVVADVLDRVDLADRADQVAGDLPLGDQKLVGIARALAGGASILLLDEPAAGLDSAESAALGDRIRALAASGMGVLLIDHDMSLMLAVSDTIHVLHFGQLIFSGAPHDAATDPTVVEAYLGAGIEGDEAEEVARG